MDKYKILHVTEVFGGGVASAIDSYTRNSKQYEHHLAYVSVPTCLSKEMVVENASRRFEMPSGHLRRIAFINKLITFSNYSLIHVHSSFAGAYVRLALSKKIVPIIYTPHCFAFERQDVSKIARFIYWVIEKLLINRTTAIAACSHREAHLALLLNSSVKISVIPNVSAPLPIQFDNWVWCNPGPKAEISLAMIGRLSPQKGVEFFLATVRCLRERGVKVAATWYGVGSDDKIRLLRDADIEVTGWLDTTSLMDRLALTNSIYLHTALWEGMPLSVLEVVKLGCPVIIRNIPAFQGLGIPSSLLVNTPDEAANAILDVMKVGNENITQLRHVFSDNNTEAQRAALVQLYDSLLPKTLN